MTSNPSNGADSSLPDGGFDAPPAATHDGAVEATVEAGTPDATADAPETCGSGPLIPNVCPLTAPSTLQEACGSMHSLFIDIKLSSCSGEPVVIYGGAGVTYCIYESAAAHALVGSILYSDVNDFCDGASYLLESGSVPSDCFNEANGSPSATDLGDCDGVEDAGKDAVAE